MKWKDLVYEIRKNLFISIPSISFFFLIYCNEGKICFYLPFFFFLYLQNHLKIFVLAFHFQTPSLVFFFKSSIQTSTKKDQTADLFFSNYKKKKMSEESAKIEITKKWQIPLKELRDWTPIAGEKKKKRIVLGDKAF